MDDKIKQAWILHINKTKSVHTAEAYTKDLRQWITFLEQKKEMTETEAFVQYKEWVEQSYKPSTAARKLCVLRNYYEYATKQGAVDVTLGLTFPVMPKTNANKEELLLIAENLKPQSPIELRDRLILYFLLEEGYKLEQVLQIKEDVELSENVTAGMKEMHRKYLSYARPKLCKKESLYLFPNKEGDAISRQMIWKRFREYQTRFGIQKTITQ